MVHSLSWNIFDMVDLIIVEPADQAAELQRVQQSIKEYLTAGMPPRMSNNLCVSPKWTKKVLLI